MVTRISHPRDGHHGTLQPRAWSDTERIRFSDPREPTTTHRQMCRVEMVEAPMPKQGGICRWRGHMTTADIRWSAGCAAVAGRPRRAHCVASSNSPVERVPTPSNPHHPHPHQDSHIHVLSSTHGSNHGETRLPLCDR